MAFETYLFQQLELHPAMQPRDAVKLCYQAAHGAEHLLEDKDAAWRYLKQEFESTTACDMPLYENISDNYARLNIAAWKSRGMDASWLFELFSAAASPAENGREVLEENLSVVEANLSRFAFSAQEWSSFIEAYRAQGMPAIHHSEQYRQAEKPAYRLVRRDMLRILPVLEAAVGCAGKPCVIAIDGRAGSGKSTAAELLSRVLDANVVHMDDFFLPLELRSEARLNEPGGNVHYERYAKEVLPHLHCGKDFSYRIFSCRTMDYDGLRNVKSGNFIIVEGSYSLHPSFGDYADIKVFSTVEPEEQLMRLKARNGEAMAKIFQAKWIPMEEKYFDACKVKDRCGLVI